MTPDHEAEQMKTKQLQISIGIIVVALLLVTIFPFVFGSRTQTITSKVDGSSVKWPSPTFSVTPGKTAVATTNVPGTMPTSISTVATTSPVPTPTVALHTGRAFISTFGPYGAGSSTMISGYGFLPGEQVALYWDYQHQAQYEFATVTTNDTGIFQYQTATPSDPNLGKGYLAGIGLTSHFLATTTIPEPANIVPVPYEIVAGNSVRVSGGGFDAGEQVMLLIEGVKVATATTDYRGWFETTVLVPATTPSGAGSNILEAIGHTSGINVYAGYFDVYFNYTLSISPTSGPAGTSVSITGAKFTPNGLISIFWLEYNSSPFGVGSVTASPTGTFTLTVTAPKCANPTCSFSILDNQAQRSASPIPFPET